VKTTGDGVLATFPSATAALAAAMRLSARLADDELNIRVGIHVGEIDRRRDDISGLAVNIAARVMSLAGDGNVAVTAPVVAALVGQAVTFESMGSHELKGIPGSWDLFSLML
jgi:class 3 adenylate cyclase